MDIRLSQDYTGNYIAIDNDDFCGCPECLDYGFGETEDEAIRNLYELKFDTMLYSFKEIKEMYSEMYRPYKTFEEYLRENFIPIYDDELNFIGYEKEDIRAMI